MPAASSFTPAPEPVVGVFPPDTDAQLGADTARAAAHTARAWAASLHDTWTGLGGFDAKGGFHLLPSKSGGLCFQYAATCSGWLRDDPPDPADSVAAWFPRALSPVGFFPPVDLATVLICVRNLPGFAVCCLRHPATGLWKTLAANPAAPQLKDTPRAFMPLSRILLAQGLPTGRLLLRARLHTALAWRTPGKVFGYLHLTDDRAVAQATALVDELLVSALGENPS